jgi:hypothetical protein
VNRYLLSAMLILGLASAGCGDDDSNPATSQTTCKVRVAHLSPDAPAVDVWVDGAKVLTNVAFKGVSSYLDLSQGMHNVKVTPTGATTPVVIDEDLSLASNTAYTVAATGLLGQNDLVPIVLVDNLTTVNGSAQVRFVHTSPDAPEVDVAVVSGPMLFDDITFRESSGYISVGAGTYNLSVKIAANGAEALRVNGQALSAGKNYTIFAVGLAGDGTLAALPVVDAD